MLLLQERVEALLEAFRPGRERERDKAQLLSPTRTAPVSESAKTTEAGYLPPHSAPVTAPGPALATSQEPSSLPA